MAYDFESAWASAGMERQVTTMQLALSQPSVQPTPGALGQISPKTVSTMTLAEIGPTQSASPGTLGTASTAKASATPGSAPGESSTGRRDYDPFGDFHFVVEIDGVSCGTFAKCDGLQIEFELIEFRHSTDPYPLKRPGMRKFGDIKLTKGYVTNTALWDWCAAHLGGNCDRKNGTIQVLADDCNAGSPVRTYNFVNAWPKQWSGFRLDGKGQGTLVEEVTLSIEYFELA